MESENKIHLKQGISTDIPALDTEQKKKEALL